MSIDIHYKPLYIPYYNISSYPIMSIFSILYVHITYLPIYKWKIFFLIVQQFINWTSITRRKQLFVI